MRSSSSSLSASSPASATCRALACFRARGPSCPANSPSPTRRQVAGGRWQKVTGNRRQEGHEGWDQYAPFYDWENARTLGRRDVPFWRTLALQSDGPVLELGCGTGRISVPLARAGVSLVGIDRSDAMLARASQRIRRGRLTSRARLIRGDIRALPFQPSTFPLVMAPYGVLQSLLRERDLWTTL